MAENPFDPTPHTVPEVLAYLETADDDERARVLAAENDAPSPRVGIVGARPDDEAPPADEGSPPDEDAASGRRRRPETTRGATFAEAAEAATPAARGYIGTSPERERTGQADKGLSQANPAVMRGGTIPDPRQGVDDSEALTGKGE